MSLAFRPRGFCACNTVYSIFKLPQRTVKICPSLITEKQAVLPPVFRKLFKMFSDYFFAYGDGLGNTLLTDMF